MRFLTEEDLRLLYRNSPFAEYHIEPGTRLTPGGRQFLNDRGFGFVEIARLRGEAGWQGSPEQKRREIHPQPPHPLLPIQPPLFPMNSWPCAAPSPFS